jgi:hypothetical protein
MLPASCDATLTPPTAQQSAPTGNLQQRIVLKAVVNDIGPSPRCLPLSIAP